MSEATTALAPEARLGDPQGKEPWACPGVVFRSPVKHLSPVSSHEDTAGLHGGGEAYRPA